MIVIQPSQLEAYHENVRSVIPRFASRVPSLSTRVGVGGLIAERTAHEQCFVRPYLARRDAVDGAGPLFPVLRVDVEQVDDAGVAGRAMADAVSLLVYQVVTWNRQRWRCDGRSPSGA